MWTRDELKNRAKRVLSHSYWKAFLASLVLALVTSGGNRGGGNAAQPQPHGYTPPLPGLHFDADLGGFAPGGWLQSYFSFIEDHLLPGILPLLLGGAFLFAFFMLLVRLFLGYNIEVGCRRYFTSAAVDRIYLGNLGFGFQNGRYWNIFVTMLYRGVVIFLWHLLLIIPGVIKRYAYAMVPYILADNPQLHYHRALQLSNEMTRGHKFDMFVLDLSFFGWYLLGALACGLGVYFVHPYRDATMAELYLTLRQDALSSGATTPQELWLA